MKTKLWVQSYGLACLAIGAFIFLLTRPEYDPIYDGKPLSKHLESCHLSGINSGGGLSNGMLYEPIQPGLDAVTIGDARDAILHEGTNALPLLVRMLTGGFKARDIWLRPIVTKFHLPQRLVSSNSPQSWRDITRALAALSVLGSNAAPAAPRIVPLLRNPDTAKQAMVALILIKPQRESEILSLTNVARIRSNSQTGSTPDMLLFRALLALGSFGTKASNAIPFIENSLSSTNERIQAAACVALARVGAKAEYAVPRIIKTLPKTDPTPPPATRPPLRSHGGTGVRDFDENLGARTIWSGCACRVADAFSD